MINIQIAAKEHISAFAEIERAAAGLFDEIDLPAHRRNETLSAQAHLTAQRQGLLLAALKDSQKPVGFAVTQRMGPFLHLRELDVHPDYQRQGIGTALLKKVIILAQDHGCHALTLTTNKFVSWNAPWYKRQGFRILRDDEIPDHLSHILNQERAKGLNPSRRVAMKRKIKAT